MGQLHNIDQMSPGWVQYGSRMRPVFSN